VPLFVVCLSFGIGGESMFVCLFSCVYLLFSRVFCWYVCLLVQRLVLVEVVS